MDGKLFLSTAKFLRNDGSDEAAYRSAISRAYYACFIEARSMAFGNCDKKARRNIDIREEKDISHNKLRQYFMSSGDKPIKELATDLRDLCANRNSADYDMRQPTGADDAQDAIVRAETILTCLTEIGPDRIGNALEEYSSKFTHGKR